MSASAMQGGHNKQVMRCFEDERDERMAERREFQIVGAAIRNELEKDGLIRGTCKLTKGDDPRYSNTFRKSA